jgi:hypothetical protein
VATPITYGNQTQALSVRLPVALVVQEAVPHDVQPWAEMRTAHGHQDAYAATEACDAHL